MNEVFFIFKDDKYLTEDKTFSSDITKCHFMNEEQASNGCNIYGGGCGSFTKDAFTQDLFTFYAIFRMKSLKKEDMLKPFVDMMAKHKMMYHWDDYAEDIIELKSDDKLFNTIQCKLLDEMVKWLHCTELFDYSLTIM